MTMLRDATHADVRAIVALGEMMHAESPHYRVLRFDGEKLAATVAQLIDAPAGLVRVVEQGGEIVAGVLALAVEHWCSRDLVSCDLAVFVRADHRGSLIGARLLDDYRAWATGLGCAMVQFGVMTGINVEQTQALAMRLGWKRQGVVLCA